MVSEVFKGIIDLGEDARLRFVGIVERGKEQDSTVRILPEFCAGLKGIEDFSHVIILYWIHLRGSDGDRRILQVFPRRHTVNVKVGVFASRSPTRPNPIGLCVVELVKVEECTLVVRGLDAYEGSPVIDVKPYIPKTDCIPNARLPDWTLHSPSA